MPESSSKPSSKLQKVLAAHGFGSRRGMEEWIKAGRIKVNGQVASIGDRVTEEDRIAVDGRYISQKAEKHRLLAYAMHFKLYLLVIHYYYIKGFSYGRKALMSKKQTYESIRGSN